MDFKEFKELQQAHVAEMLKDASHLFVASVDANYLWDLYLDSFPAGTNEVFRERREFDCSCCRHFIKRFGNVVAITDDYEIVTIWDFQTNDDKFQPVLDSLSGLIRDLFVRDVFVTKDSAFGDDVSYELLGDNSVKTWHHYRIDLPSRLVLNSSKTVESVTAQYRDIKNVFQRSLEEIKGSAVETVLDLIAERSLYKGDEWVGLLKEFLALYSEYHGLEREKQDNFCWVKSAKAGATVGKIRNHSIGVLLVDISSGVDLDGAVRKYELIVAPTNYKRPKAKAIFSKKMVEGAQETIENLGFLDSLGRRHATLADITINNVLWVNRDAERHMGGAGGVFELLKQEVTENPKSFASAPGIDIEDFVNDILPGAQSLEVLLENGHESSLMALIAPEIAGSKSMFKWGNGFSWAYNGNITDSMKERVKFAGGKVDGVLRLTLQWGDNNDLDLHCVEPDGNHIYFDSKGIVHESSGMLDVDIIHPSQDSRVRDGIAVENIIYSDKDRMFEGLYKVYINNYSHRGGRTGFQAEIEHGGQVYSYDYSYELRELEDVLVAEFEFSRKSGIKFLKSLSSSSSSKTVWNLATNQFHPVSAFMFSPNYWDGQAGIGHKHYFFIVSGCKADDRLNGFFNEFLQEDLMRHKRVFEALGSKMKVTLSDEQLSGLGFSSTKRNALVCRVDNKKIVKVVF